MMQQYRFLNLIQAVYKLYTPFYKYYILLFVHFRHGEWFLTLF